MLREIGSPEQKVQTWAIWWYLLWHFWVFLFKNCVAHVEKQKVQNCQIYRIYVPLIRYRSVAIPI